MIKNILELLGVNKGILIVVGICLSICIILFITTKYWEYQYKRLSNDYITLNAQFKISEDNVKELSKVNRENIEKSSNREEYLNSKIEELQKKIQSIIVENWSTYSDYQSSTEIDINNSKDKVVDEVTSEKRINARNLRVKSWNDVSVRK